MPPAEAIPPQEPTELPALSPEELYVHNLTLLSDRTDALAEDPTVVWRPNDRKNPEGNRTASMKAPIEAGQPLVTTKVSVIDEPGKGRWYVAHVTQGESTMAVSWQRGTVPYTRRRGHEPRRTSAEELGLMAKVTDPTIADVARHDTAAESLSPSHRIARRVGRLLGSKIVTRWH